MNTYSATQSEPTTEKREHCLKARIEKVLSEILSDKHESIVRLHFERKVTS